MRNVSCLQKIWFLQKKKKSYFKNKPFYPRYGLNYTLQLYKDTSFFRSHITFSNQKIKHSTLATELSLSLTRAWTHIVIRSLIFIALLYIPTVPQFRRRRTNNFYSEQMEWLHGLFRLVCSLLKEKKKHQHSMCRTPKHRIKRDPRKSIDRSALGRQRERLFSFSLPLSFFSP